MGVARQLAGKGAAGHGIRGIAVQVEELVAPLALLVGGHSGSPMHVGAQALAVADQAPAAVGVVVGPEVALRRQVAARVVTEAEVVADLMAELVALAAPEREHAVAAAQAVGLQAVAIESGGVVGDHALEQLRLGL